MVGTVQLLALIHVCHDGGILEVRWADVCLICRKSSVAGTL